MQEYARHRLALRDPQGGRVEVAPGHPLPAWLPETTRAELRALGSVECPVATPAPEPPEPDVLDVPPRRASRARATTT